MHEVVRYQLRDLVLEQGVSLGEDPDRCFDRLREACPTHMESIELIVLAVELGIPNDLRELGRARSWEQLRTSLSGRMEATETDPQAALWTLDTWGYALGLVTPEDFKTPDTIEQDAAATAGVIGFHLVRALCWALIGTNFWLIGVALAWWIEQPLAWGEVAGLTLMGALFLSRGAFGGARPPILRQRELLTRWRTGLFSLPQTGVVLMIVVLSDWRGLLIWAFLVLGWLFWYFALLFTTVTLPINWRYSGTGFRLILGALGGASVGLLGFYSSGWQGWMIAGAVGLALVEGVTSWNVARKLQGDLSSANRRVFQETSLALLTGALAGGLGYVLIDFFRDPTAVQFQMVTILVIAALELALFLYLFFTNQAHSRWERPARGGIIFEGHGAPVCRVTFSGDNQDVLSQEEWGGIRAWNPETGKTLLRFEAGHDVIREVLLGPSELLTVHEEGEVRIWSCEQTEPIETAQWSMEYNTENAIVYADHAELGMLVTAGVKSESSGDWQIHLSDPDHPGTVTTLELDEGKKWKTIQGLAINAESNRVAVYDGGAKTMHVWDVSNPGAPMTWKLKGIEELIGLELSPDGSMILGLGGDGALALWSSSDGELLFHTDKVSPKRVTLAFAPDNRHFAIGDEEGTIHLWDVERKTDVQTFQGEDKSIGAVLSLAFSHDGRYLASGSADWTVRLWELT